MSDKINQSVLTFDLVDLPELESDSDMYMVKIGKMGLSIFMKSNCKATSWEIEKENPDVYGIYSDKNTLIGDLDQIIQEILSRSESRVIETKEQIHDYLAKLEMEEEHDCDKRKPKDKLSRYIDRDPTERELDNAVEALKEEGKIEETAESSAGEQLRLRKDE